MPKVSDDEIEAFKRSAAFDEQVAAILARKLGISSNTTHEPLLAAVREELDPKLRDRIKAYFEQH